MSESGPELEQLLRNVITSPCSLVITFSGSNKIYTITEPRPKMVFENLGEDICRNIFSYITIADAMNIRMLSKTLMQIVAECKWDSPETIYNVELWRKCFPNAISANLDRGRVAVAIHDKELKYLSGIPKVNLTGANITNDGLKYLMGIRELNISNTNITNDELKYLMGIRELNISNTNITNDGLKYLTGIHELNITNCYITHHGLKYLSGIHTLIACHAGITPKGLQSLPTLGTLKHLDISGMSICDNELSYLKDCHTLILRNCTFITNNGMQYLSNVHTLDLTGTCIRDDGLKHLTGVHTLILPSGIFGYGLQYLTSIKSLNIRYCDMRDNCLSYLAGIQKLNLSKCDNITDEGIDYLKSTGLQELIIYSCPLIVKNKGAPVIISGIEHYRKTY